tara:strand:- start:247 stop:573 length:327 start_codon:yes stop_codon:yes gene_type:complete
VHPNENLLRLKVALGLDPAARFSPSGQVKFSKKVIHNTLTGERLCVIFKIMTTQTTFEPCNQCGNQALLLEGNNGTCLLCLFPAPKRELEGQFLEGCECENCEKHFNG